MNKGVAILCLTLAAAVALPPLCPAPLVWRSGEGWVYEGSDQEDIELANNAREQFEIAQAYEQAGELGRALGAYRSLVRRFPQTLEAPKAQYKMGFLLERNGDFQAAFKAYEDLIQNYPRSQDFENAIESMFRIATLYLDGEKIRLLGIPIWASMERARKMYAAVIAAAPFGKFSPLAQFNIGQALERQQKYAEAVEAYQKVVQKYPLNDIADDAQFQIGYAWMQISREGLYDQMATARAIEAFDDFLFRYPNSEKVPQAQNNIDLLLGRLKQSAFEIARFYDKKGDKTAAIIYYNAVLGADSDSEESQYAIRRIEELEATMSPEEAAMAEEKADVRPATPVTPVQREAQADVRTRPDYVGPSVSPSLRN